MGTAIRQASLVLPFAARWSFYPVADTAGTGKVSAWSVSNPSVGVAHVGYVGVDVDDQDVIIGQYRRAGNGTAALIG